jgi:hypothetical protein
MEIIIALLGIALLAAAYWDKLTGNTPPPPPERREYPISVTIGQITIHQLIITEIPVPFRRFLPENGGRIESGSGNAPMGYRISPE